MVDLNCDVGESYGNFRIGNDAELIPLITSANIACGFHGGDPLTMERAIGLALQHNVQIGAHPSAIRDLEGFGRRKMSIDAAELASNLKYQIGALQNMTACAGGEVKYVKAHGALYHQCLNDPDVALTFVQTVQSMGQGLKVLSARSDSILDACQNYGVELILEGFADRRYQPDGQLLPRSHVDAIISNPDLVCEQAMQLARGLPIQTQSGRTVQVDCQSICIHGDHEGAIESLRLIQKSMSEGSQ